MFQTTEIHNGKPSVSHMTYQRRWNKIVAEVPRQQPHAGLWPSIHENDDQGEGESFNLRRLFNNFFQTTPTQEEVQQQQMPGKMFIID